MPCHAGTGCSEHRGGLVRQKTHSWRGGKQRGTAEVEGNRTSPHLGSSWQVKDGLSFPSPALEGHKLQPLELSPTPCERSLPLSKPHRGGIWWPQMIFYSGVTLGAASSLHRASSSHNPSFPHPIPS